MAKSRTTSPAKGASSTSTNGKAPKIGAAAGRRIADIKKESGAAEAKTVTAKATEIALKKGDRLVRIEAVLEAEGKKATDDLVAQYRGKSTGTKKSAKKGSTAGKTGRGNAQAAAKTDPKGGQSRTSKPKTGSGSGKSKTEQLRKLREDQAKASKTETPPEPEKQPEPTKPDPPEETTPA